MGEPPHRRRGCAFRNAHLTRSGSGLPFSLEGEARDEDETVVLGIWRRDLACLGRSWGGCFPVTGRRQESAADTPPHTASRQGGSSSGGPVHRGPETWCTTASSSSRSWAGA